MGFIPYLNQGWHYTYGFSWGGKFFDYASCQVTPDDPPIVEAFKWVQNYCVGQDAVKINAFGGAGGPSRLRPGTASVPRRHARHADHRRLGNRPNGAVRAKHQLRDHLDASADGWRASATWAGGWSLAIPQGAKNVEDAWAAIKWICGEAVAGSTPPRASTFPPGRRSE